MIDLVLPESRMGFADTLMQMHQDRKRVFVDRLGWQLSAPGSWLEVDEFDNDFAVYLIARSDCGRRHVGSVRLLPSTRPHMLDAVFGALCSGEVPKGEDVWEISRLITSPVGANGTTVLKLHRLLALALVEFAEANGISRYTLVTEPHRVPALLSVGWKVMPLGLPMPFNGEMLQALQIQIGTETLAEMRERTRIEQPVLRVAEADRRAA
ncbi:MAG TPA: acyl-homoserine-lactone synthase [Allosphingosinicella sp.]|uniref:acyl-homoserine-lactone synthase n=1 Tax=Allosphingosinicella sp. TaxID=2823234 RepID=UPI002ED963C4